MALDTVHYAIGGVPHSQRTDKELIFSKRKWDVEDKKFGGDPMYWVNIHRHHHQFADSDRDVHSPLEGYWFSHINWIFHNNYLKEKLGEQNNVMDLQKQAFYRFLQGTQALHLLGLACLLYVVGGLPYLIWGMAVKIACGHHLIGMVTSVCHKWGKAPWNTKGLSKNNWVVVCSGMEKLGTTTITLSSFQLV